jgi:hypothetical protein
MAIVTLAEAKAEIGENGTARDTKIQRWIDSATPLVESIVGPVVPRAVTQAVTHRGTVLLEGRVVSVTSVTLDGAPVTGYTLNAAAGLMTGAPVGSVILYTVGFSPIPEAIRQAVMYAVQHTYESDRGAVPVPYAAGTDETFTVSRGFFLPNRARELLEPYRLGGTVG